MCVGVLTTSNQLKCPTLLVLYFSYLLSCVFCYLFIHLLYFSTPRTLFYNAKESYICINDICVCILYKSDFFMVFKLS